MVTCAAAFSVHPDAAVAAGEVIGSLLEQLPSPTTVVVMASGDASLRLADILEAADALLSPDVLIGMTSRWVRGNGSQPSRHALALWACDGDGIRPVRLEADPEDPDEFLLAVAEDDTLGSRERLLLFCDPETVDADALVAWKPDHEICAGFLDGVHTGGFHRLFVGQDEFDDGAVGLAFDADVADVVLDRGVRQVGDYWTVTAADRLDPVGGVMMGGRTWAERADEVGVHPDRTVLGVVTLDRDGEPVFVPPRVGVDPLDQPTPVVGELCALWVYDAQLFAPDVVTGVEWFDAPTHLGFGPELHQFDPTEVLGGVAATTSLQIGTFLGVRSIFSDAFAAAVLR